MTNTILPSIMNEPRKKFSGIRFFLNICKIGINNIIGQVDTLHGYFTSHAS